MPQDTLTPEAIRHWPQDKSLLAVTAYDYPFARMLDEAGVDILHVGDSMGMVVLGLPDTTGVTLDDILRATEAVARGRKHALITADLPYGTYSTPEEAVSASRRLVDAGADAVKMEGGRDILPQVEAVIAEGIAFQGHLGMLPQRVHQEGGYKRKGKTQAEADALLADATALEKAGAFSIVLEVVVKEVAAQVTQALGVPTIGIASGAGTRGQIRVLHDVLGLYPWFVPAHASAQAQLHEQVREAMVSLRKSL